MSDPISLGLPHREPFVFIDEIVVLCPGESAEARKCFPPSTAFFAGHFPGRPIVPGVILAEALAQTAGIAAAREGASFLLSAIRSMKFPSAALPDEIICLHARKTGNIGPLWQFEVRASVGDRVVAEGAVILNEVVA
ncbi:MAG: 3-hydroxyacyl-[acyl-carrier-protein] dehydratase FabZ [Verrucomicrobiota bacterium]|jgi:3-hydroxyacyl-[acyl-carrier-protein] dehydratase